MSVAFVLCFFALFAVHNDCSNNVQATRQNGGSLVGFSFLRPTRETKTDTTVRAVINVGPNEIDKWCPSTTRAQLKPYCECTGPYVFPVISCQRLDSQKDAARLKVIKFSVSNVGKLKLNDSTLTRFDGYNMPIKVPIQYVQIEKTKIREIDLRAFVQSADTLIRLQVIHSELQKFPFSELKNFRRLQYLDLYYNALTNIPDFAFGFNPYITSIDLSFNSISYVGSYAFYNLPKLQYLDLRFNKLKVINNNAFTSRFPKYDLSLGLTLDLSHNKMFLIADDAFQRTTFKKIDLTENSLKKFNKKIFEPIMSTMVTVRQGIVAVSGNRFVCNCDNVGWLTRSSVAAKNTVQGFKCDTPERLRYKNLSDLTSQDVGCYS